MKSFSNLILNDLMWGLFFLGQEIILDFLGLTNFFGFTLDCRPTPTVFAIQTLKFFSGQNFCRLAQSGSFGFYIFSIICT